MKSKPKVYLFTDWFTPGYKAGGPIKSAQTMIDLIKSDVDFFVITRNTDWMEHKPYAQLSNTWTKLDGFQVFYESGDYLNYNLKILRSISKGDTVYFNGIYSPLFNALPICYLMLSNRGLSIIVSARGMLNPNALAIKPFKKLFLLKILKWLGVEKKVKFHAASNEEIGSIKKLFPRSSVAFVSNVPAIPRIKYEIIESGKLKKFISIGRISRVKNTDYLIDVFKETHGLELSIVGSYDDKEFLENCQSRANKSNSKIEFVGPKSPSSISAEIVNYGFFILATSGENFGHAIIEALANGLPVIISDQTPWNDIESYEAGWIISLKDRNRWQEIIVKASHLTADEYLKMSQRAIEYVRSKFNIDEICDQYLELFGAKS